MNNCKLPLLFIARAPNLVQGFSTAACNCAEMKYILLFVLHYLWAVGAVVNFNFDVQPEKIIYAEDNRIRGFRDHEDKDFVLGGLFAVHGISCQLLGTSGVERIEAFLYALDLINNDPNLLPNITLGYDIRDTCGSETVALDETVEMIFSQGLVDANECNEIVFSGGLNDTSLPVSAIIGATTSQVSISVASLLRLFTTPQVSYSSSSPILNDRETYSYFYRTIPPDDQQAQAIVDLLVKFGWTFVSAIHSNTAYGDAGIEEFRQLAQRAGICIDLDLGIDNDITFDELFALTSRVINESSPNVIVFFASTVHVGFFFELYRIIESMSGMQRRFLWIASDSWAGSDIIRDLYGQYIGSFFGFLPLTNFESNYDDYFSQLTLSTNERNPWFTEYIESIYGCTAGVDCVENVSASDSPNYIRRPVELVIDAVYSVSHALHNFLMDNCDLPVVYNRTSQTCQGQKNELTGVVLRDYLQNVDFISPSGNRIDFDSNGNIEGRYVVTNLQLKSSCIDCPVQYGIANVGDWKGTRQSTIQFIENVTLQFGVNEAGNQLPGLESQCQQCEPGHIIVSVQASCCGICSPCLGPFYTNETASSSECSICRENEWGNDPLNGSSRCQAIRESYLDHSDAWGIFLIILALGGLIAVILVIVALGIFWNTPIIKSSGREQMILLLIGITLCFLLSVFFIVKPSIPICFFQRVSTWFCFSLILSALFIKLVRITRIFLRDHGSGRPKFITPIYQIIFTLILVAGQMLLVVISLAVVPPDVATEQVNSSENTNDFPVLVVSCARPHVALIGLQMLYFSALLIATNALAILTIRFPANFNEVKYVAFSTFCIGIIWIAFVVIFFATQGDREVQTAIISFAIQMSALAVLFCMFVPRIFIMLVWPKKNKQSELNTPVPSTTTSTMNTKNNLQVEMK